MMATDPPKLDLGTLEEDDDFEEFPAEVYADDDQYEAEVSVWEDNWEDDVVADDFHDVLRVQLEKLKNLNMVVEENK